MTVDMLSTTTTCGWLAALGPRPSDADAARSWYQTAHAVAAYRDAWNVTDGNLLGDRTSLPQRDDAVRIRTLLAHRAGGSDSRPASTASSAPRLQ